MCRRQRNGEFDTGVASVEFALVLPILVLLMFGVVVAGTVAAAQLQVQAAARDGARAGSLSSGGGCGVSLNRLDAADGTGSPSVGQVTCTNLAVCPGTTSSVSVVATRTVSIPVLGNRQVTLDSVATYECPPSV